MYSLVFLCSRTFFDFAFIFNLPPPFLVNTPQLPSPSPTNSHPKAPPFPMSFSRLQCALSDRDHSCCCCLLIRSSYLITGALKEQRRPPIFDAFFPLFYQWESYKTTSCWNLLQLKLRRTEQSNPLSQCYQCLNMPPSYRPDPIIIFQLLGIGIV